MASGVIPVVNVVQSMLIERPDPYSLNVADVLTPNPTCESNASQFEILIFA